MGVERGHDDTRPPLAQRAEQPREPVDARGDGLGGDRGGDAREREVRGDERGGELRGGEGHHDLGGAEALGEVLGVPAEALAAGGAARRDGELGDGARDERRGEARADEVGGLVDPRELGSARGSVGLAEGRRNGEAGAATVEADLAGREGAHLTGGRDGDDAARGDAADGGSAADHGLVADEHAARVRAPRGAGDGDLGPDARGAADADGERGTDHHGGVDRRCGSTITPNTVTPSPPIKYSTASDVPSTRRDQHRRTGGSGRS